jgi:hypothetical protein
MEKMTNQEISSATKSIIFGDVSRQRPNLGPSEFGRAFNVAMLAYDGNNVALTREILKEVDAFRARHTPGYTTLSGGVYGTSDFWAKVHATSEAEAKRELLSGSAELAELDSLESAATKAKAKADAKTAELNAAFAEWNALPDRAARLQHQLTNCGLERTVLDEASLVERIKSNYREWLQTGNQGRKVDADYWSAVLASRTLKVQVIDELETQLRSELKTLDKRNVELSKVLNTRRHQLS